MLGADFRFTSRPASTGARHYVGCALTLILLLFGVSAGQAKAQASAGNSGTGPRVIELRIGDEVEPIMAEYIDGGIAEAARQHANLILITMDTPGGLGTSMEDMIQHILASPVPVAVYVSPTGARGASAGFFILMSADVAAMAPGTHAGAASPLLEIGGVPLNVDQTLKNKILNDATAFLRSYVGKRGRNVQVAETAVTEGKAFTDTEALNDKLIDLVANSPEDLLAKLNGQSIKRFDGSTTQLNLDHPQIVGMEMSARERFLSRIVQPDVLFCFADCGRARSLYRIHASGHDRARCDRRNRAGLGPIRHAHSSGKLCGPAFNRCGDGPVHSGGQVHEPWRSSRWRYHRHAARRFYADPLADHGRRRQLRRGPGRDGALRAGHDFPDAPGAALAFLEAVHWNAATAWGAG